eukprot:CAMPEP_0197534038 /NCGR_PEP_ID=MMETSP1318-20131121/45758_1 /TAXON_ID=552666 /ORGANISM="Partenskyella glossopodia, Strain RCC365" /LENGTH=71 /DNA_ID=CAMNT_0043091151 /DNA_START=548 /DNA_END=764 /DNA_ORIENTATION=-
MSLSGAAVPEIGAVLGASGLAAESAFVAGAAIALDGASGAIIGGAIGGIGALSKLTLGDAIELNKSMFIPY